MIQSVYTCEHIILCFNSLYYEVPLKINKNHVFFTKNKIPTLDTHLVYWFWNKLTKRMTEMEVAEQIPKATNGGQQCTYSTLNQSTAKILFWSTPGAIKNMLFAVV